jgi:hypothetical protein
VTKSKNDFADEGAFWIPGTNLRLPGAIEERDGVFRLQLRGCFPVDDCEYLSEVHGVLGGNRQVTLWDANQVSSRTTFIEDEDPRRVVSTYECDTCIHDIHASSQDTQTFEFFEARLPELDMWLDIAPFRMGRNGYLPTIEVQPVADLSASVAGGEIRLRAGFVGCVSPRSRLELTGC